MPWIGSYTKRDGTEVRAHWRSPAGARTQTALLAVVVLVVIGMSGGTGSDTGSHRKTPEPRQTAQYPIKFRESGGKARKATPRPGVSYPIKFPRRGVKERKPQPRSTVSYPIRFPSSGGDRG